MTTYRTSETVVRRVEWAAEAGSNIGTVNRVESMAWQDYCTRNGLADRSISSAPDDWCQVNITDDEIVFAFEVEHKPEAGEEALVRVREALRKVTERWALNSGRLAADDLGLITDALSGAGVS